MDDLPVTTSEPAAGPSSSESGVREEKDLGEKRAEGGEEESFRKLCTHYSRGCSLVSPCCGKVYPCRLCHNEKDLTHEIDRHAVSEIVCRKCNTKQPVSNLCSSCGLKFATYFCPVCRLYDDTDKQQFHCDKCGLCRVGGQENFFHCDTCGLCLPVGKKESHLCRQGASRTNCPVCMEDIHTSCDSAHVPDCGHLLHMTCFKNMVSNGLYQCPLCYRSMTDMTKKWEQMDKDREEWQMPFHLRNFLVKIQCRDCRQESISSFHIVGLKCLNCSSYNTVRCGNEELPEDAEVALDDLRMQMVLDMIHQIVQARQRERMPALMQRIRERQAAREAAREAARQAAAGGGEGGGEGEGRGGREEGDAVVPQIESDSESEDHSDSEENGGRSGSDGSEGEGENTGERDPPELETDSGSYESPPHTPPVLESEDGSYSGNQGGSDDEESSSDAGMNSWPPFWALHSPNSDGSQDLNSDASWETEEEEEDEEEENKEENNDGSENIEKDLEDDSTGPTHSTVAATSYASQASKGNIPPVRRSDRVSDDSQEWETASEEMSIDKDT